MADSVIQVPHDLEDPIVLRRFLSLLVEQVDLARGARSESKFNTFKETEARTLQLKNAALVGANVSDNTLVGSTLTVNEVQSKVDSLSASLVTAGVAYSQSEAQINEDSLKAVSDKLDSVILALRKANVIKPN